MKIYKLSLIVFSLLICFNSFSQIDTAETNRSYRVIAIDSTENSYVIFVSSNLWDTLSDVNAPFLSKDNECNYYSIYHYDNTKQYCLVNPKIKGLNKNICVGCIYNLSLNCITDRTLNSVNVHIGYGDYILQHSTDDLWTANEVVGLSYEENIDSINYYSAILYQQELFDSKMFYIWMNLNKQTDICYSQWLNEKINQIKLICLNFDKDTIILYQDENCKTPHKVIKRKDYYENGAVETSLLCKYGDKYFIRISNTMNVIYGWIKKCKKQTLPCN